MDNKEIKQMLKDAGLLLIDASKDWPKHPEMANKRVAVALMRVADVDQHLSYDNRPMGAEEEDDEKV